MPGTAGGLAADGSRLVLIASDYRRPTEATRLLLIDGERLVTRARLNLEGTYSFDAISSDGDLMYLVEYEDPRDPLDYRVRAYDLSAGEFLPGEIVDPEEPDERMSGQPIARESSPDGRWAFTLYGGGEETFIHALDTEGATAKCIDLEQFGPRALYNLDMRSDPETGELTVIHKGDVAAHVDPESFEVSVPVGTTIFESPELLLLRLARSIR